MLAIAVIFGMFGLVGLGLAALDSWAMKGDFDA